MFQPGEETFGGAQAVMAEGVLENQELLQAIMNSSKTRAEILAFLESK